MDMIMVYKEVSWCPNKMFSGCKNVPGFKIYTDQVILSQRHFKCSSDFIPKLQYIGKN